MSSPTAAAGVGKEVLPGAPSSTPTVALSASGASIPFNPSAPIASDGVGLPAALLICLLVLAVGVALLRRGKLPMVRGQPQMRLQVLESRMLGDRTRVTVLRYRNRELLVAHSEHVVTVLSDAVAGEEQR